MRISDWSSDVCSSDLAERRILWQILDHAGDAIILLEIAAGERQRLADRIVVAEIFCRRFLAEHQRMRIVERMGGIAAHEGYREHVEQIAVDEQRADRTSGG